MLELLPLLGADLFKDLQAGPAVREDLKRGKCRETLQNPLSFHDSFQ